MSYVKINKCMINYKGPIKVKDHPYYLALKKESENLYDKTIERDMYQRSKESGTWKGLKKLVLSIKNNGFLLKKAPIVFKWGDMLICHHGRHRLCILRYLYRSHLKLKIDKHGVVISIYNGRRKISK